MLGAIPGPFANMWVGEAEGTTDVSWHRLHVVYIALLYSFVHVLSQTTHVLRLLHCLGYSTFWPAYRLTLIGRPLGLSTSDSNSNYKSNNNNNSNNNDNSNKNDNNNGNVTFSLLKYSWKIDKLITLCFHARPHPHIQYSMEMTDPSPF